MKVAQHEVLGNDAKRYPSRQGRSKCLAPSLSHAAHQRKQPSIVPSDPGRVTTYQNVNPALRTGLLSLGPSGTTCPGTYFFPLC
jgi:hypothetical protein